MERSLRRVRRPWKAFACAVLATALAACGGGGGSSPPPDDGGSGNPPPESSYLLAEFVAQDTNGQYIRVWDPAHPDAAIQQVQIASNNGVIWTASHLVFSDATAYDAATRTVRTLGHAKAFFDSGGRIWSIDLRGGHDHAPVRVSAVVDATTVLRVFPMDAAGDDAWLDVSGGINGWAVRSTMTDAEPGVAISSIAAALRDDTGLPQYFLVALGGRSGTDVRAVTFDVRTPAFVSVPLPALATMDGTDAWLGADPGQPGLGYIRLDNEVRALRWSAAGPSVDAGSVQALAHAIEVTTATVGADAVYVGDGTSVFAVADGHATAVGELSNAARAIVDAGDYLGVYEFEFLQMPPQCCRVIEALRKSDGARTRLAAAEQLTLAGATAQRIVYATGPAVDSGTGFSLVAGDGSGRVDVPGAWVGLVRAATAGVDQPGAALALLTCAPAAGKPGFCGPGTLAQVDIASGASIGLGELAPASVWMQAPRGDAIAGLPFALGGESKVDSPAGFGTDDTDQRDAWQFTPGVAGSLARVTTNVP